MTSSHTLNESVFGAWKSDTHVALAVKCLLTYVTGQRRCPPAPAEDMGSAASATPASIAAKKEAEKEHNDWVDKDGQARAIIARRLPYDHRHLLTTSPTSKALWDAIMEKYESRRSAAATMTTLVDMFHRRWVDGTIEGHINYYRETNQLLAKFDPSGSANPAETFCLPERVLTGLLVASIPDAGHWGTVKATIFINEVFGFEQTAARLMAEAHRLKLNEAMNPARPAEALPSPTAHYSRAQAARCTHCGKSGHRDDKCWGLHPELAPDDVQERKRQSKKDAKKTGKKGGSKARRQSSSDESNDDWHAHCAVLMDGNRADSTASEQTTPTVAVPASALTSASVPASLRVSDSDGEPASDLGSCSSSKVIASDWLVDSAASQHCCNQREMFNAFEPATGKGSSVILGDGRRIPVRGSGTIKVSASTLGRPSSGTLRDVLYTPDMAVSLLSVPSLASAGLEVLFRDRGCTIRQGRKVIAQARKAANNLFQLTLVKRAKPAALSARSDQARPDFGRRSETPGRGGAAPAAAGSKPTGPALASTDIKPAISPRRSTATYAAALTQGLRH